ncbi:MAG: hypothetical protein H6861_01940 [Rhodospirillales bacterium]|nr:hypothetical protein [Rhodospirillales bacterium]
MASKDFIQSIKSMSKKTLSRQPLSQRFSDIATLVRGVRNNVPEFLEDSGFAVDPWDKHKNVRPHVEAMLHISETIRHSQTYLDFLENSRDLTLRSIQDDRGLLESIAHYLVSCENDQKAVIQAVNLYQAAASCEASDFDFGETSIVFFEEAKRYYKQSNAICILNGSSVCNLKTGSRKIKINTHDDTGFRTSLNALGIVFHEGVHDQIFQLAFACHTKDKSLGSLGSLAEDAELYAIFKEKAATIPSGIRLAYLEQFHEIVAHDQQSKFMSALNSLLKSAGCSTLSQPH